jgi:hypothetical protein
MAMFWYVSMSDEKEKISLKTVKKMPWSMLNRQLKKMREYLKQNEVVQKMFQDYDVDIAEIDLVPMQFGDLEVSAKTDHAVIIFNYKLLTGGNFADNFHYGTHELEHYLQQTAGKKATKSADDGDYLHNPYEQKAFSRQVLFIAEEDGKDKAEQYVDDLLEHHDKDKDNKEGKKLKDKLLEQV